ncbi:SGNH/GDSL hydrolase family protein [Beijerinckia mobilis]|uniref:SGNH/GDSL hydrolase family protein n=1 Tax=Beijerinckia mobilis TaxID=231434 RepID=UPI0012EB3D99|nr:SGNH/GDSL hydrolase family protein [Beijerinckia mobilis]
MAYKYYTLMPPSDGSKNSLTVNGRTYSATPNSSISVPDFDANVLMANGWTRISNPSTSKTQTVRQIATRCYVPSHAPIASNKYIISCTTHQARDTVTQMAAVFPNFYVDSTTFQDTNGPGVAATINAAYVEYPFGTFTPFKFGGSTTGSIPNASFMATDLAAVNIPNGATFRIHFSGYFPNGIIYCPNTNTRNLTGGDKWNFGASPYTGFPTNYGTDAGSGFYGPCAIVGPSSRLAVALIGDSIMFGYMDAVSDLGADTGIMARAVGAKYAYINMGVPSDRTMYAATGFVNRATLTNLYCQGVISNYGINDLAASRTWVQLSADLQTLYGKLSGKPILQCTIGPKTTSSDGWTSATQTLFAGEAERKNANSAIRGCLPNTIGHVEVANVLETGWNTGLYKFPGFTTDGTHPNQAGNLLLAFAGAVDMNFMG